MWGEWWDYKRATDGIQLIPTSATLQPRDMPFLALSSLERETIGLCYRVEAIAVREVLAAVLALEFLRDTDCEEPARWEEALTRFQASWVRVPS